MMSFCTNCLYPQNPDDAQFCLKCGKLILLKERYLPLYPLGKGGFGMLTGISPFDLYDDTSAGLWVLIWAFYLLLLEPNYQLLVPDFFFPEIGHILWKRVRRGEMNLDDAQNDLELLLGLPLQICLSPRLILMATK
ncbi:hypothetical protein PN471_00160 [Aphanizomenon sp. CS-733/32]|uniref:hypothetical protein n=1 Tax=Aphanizomenon sp. CS-733/32 TaxID=3021715 RepID=UPI00232CFC2E|nr:hypothetical protein [Aphanizomenon sp. CS-733/32]MDB9307101.1 hypothetical protein [Aphanizomenon sp. CS-733/32]